MELFTRRVFSVWQLLLLSYKKGFVYPVSLQMEVCRMVFIMRRHPLSGDAASSLLKQLISASQLQLLWGEPVGEVFHAYFSDAG